MKVKFSAVIPVVDFGNVQPEIELEGDDYKKLEEEGMGYIREAWNKYSKSPFPNNVVGNFKKFDTFTGEQILYDDSQHLYTDLQGNKLISGSEYAKSKAKQFDLELLSGKVAMKYDVPQEIVKKMWSSNGNLSADFGSCIHGAIENWFLFRNFGTEKQYHLPKPKFLRDAVESYPHLDKNILPEVLVSDVKSGRCGRIDQLEIVDSEKKICNIYDIKSDSDISKNIVKHTHQLSFYADILTEHGWTVQSIYVDNFTEGWKTIEIKRVESK